MSLCDQKRFKQIYFQWNAPLQRFLLSKGVGSEKANDLLQESFIKLWNNCAKVPVEKAKSFLFTVA
ncbi:MAG: RNA polymerase subunit sigma-70, partial [Bacteroidota bacterium]